jgi:hypothetical protein
MVDFTSRSRIKMKRPSGMPPAYTNTISSRYEHVALASIDGIVDERVWLDPKWKLRKCSFRRWVLKDRFNSERSISAWGS